MQNQWERTSPRSAAIQGDMNRSGVITVTTYVGNQKGGPLAHPGSIGQASQMKGHKQNHPSVSLKNG